MAPYHELGSELERWADRGRRDGNPSELIFAIWGLHHLFLEYQAHDNTARPHQGITQHVPDGHRDTRRATVTDLDATRAYRKPSWAG